MKRKKLVSERKQDLIFTFLQCGQVLSPTGSSPIPWVLMCFLALLLFDTTLLQSIQENSEGPI